MCLCGKVSSMARTKQTMRASRAAVAKSLRKGAVGGFRSFKRKGQVAARRTTNLARATVVSSLLAEEGKFFDTFFVGATGASSDMTGAEMDPSTVLCLNAMPQGDTASTREGNKTVVTGVSIRGTVQVSNEEAGTAPGDESNAVVYLVQDTQTTGGSAASGTQLNSEDVFTNPGSGSSTPAINALRNMTKNPGRYKVLAKADINVKPMITQLGANDYSAGRAQQRFEIYWKGMIPVKHQANNGTIADIADNSLHVIGFGNSLVVNYNSRVYFKG